jgi:hypothetical protein
MDERTMTYHSTLPLNVLLSICFLGGLFIGYCYFRALRETANLIVGGGKPLRAIVLTLARISLLATGFFIAVLAGAFPLLAALAGVLCAKWIMLRRIQEIQT